MNNTKFRLRTILCCMRTHCILFRNPMTQLTISQMMLLEMFLFNMNKWSFQIGVIFKCYMAFANFMSTFFNSLHWFLCFIEQSLIFFPWKKPSLSLSLPTDHVSFTTGNYHVTCFYLPTGSDIILLFWMHSGFP